MNTAPAADFRPTRLIWPIDLIADLGGLALLVASSAAVPFRGRHGAAPILRVSLANAGWMLAMGMPLVALIHMSIGSFLAMQAYFGATFTEAAGIVVGLGLVRNIAPLLSGFVFAGLVGVKITSELKGGPRPGLDDLRSVPDRDVERGVQPDDRPVPSAGRIALARLLGAALAGPVLTLWGVVVGGLMGLVVAKSMLGQQPVMFLGKMVEMLNPVDIVGLGVKAILFCGSSTLIATFEGLRPESRGGPDAYRAVVRSVIVILFLNFTWFNLVYLAGDPFGPNVAARADEEGGMGRASHREVGVGLLVLLGIVGLVGLLIVAGGGPGFLAQKRTIEVVFRDGQGLRVGSPVRVAGIDSGRVESIDLAEVEGTLRARVKISIPVSLATRLRQDAKIAVQSGLTGQCVINVVSSGRSSVALVPGQIVMGVESSFFDPVLQQVGLGAEERSHLSHTIAEVRQTVDAAGPKLRRALAAIQDAAVALQETVEQAKPKVVATAGHVEEIAGKIEDAKIDELVKRLNLLTAQAEGLIRETRPQIGSTLKNVAELSATASALAKDEKPKIDELLTGLNGTRVKADRVLANAESMTGTGAAILAKNRGDIERVMGNVRDASDFGVKLVQKLMANPFYLSPFYKPTAADLKAQEVYASADMFLKGAKELDDAIKTLQAMQNRPMTEQDRKAYIQMFEKAWNLLGSLKQTQQQLAEGLNTPNRR